MRPRTQFRPLYQSNLYPAAAALWEIREAERSPARPRDDRGGRGVRQAGDPAAWLELGMLSVMNMTSANVPTDETSVEIGGGREARSYRSEWLTSPNIS